LEWKPHSGFNAIRLTADGRAPASDLRALFAKYQQGAANILLPAYPTNSPLEMACFDLSKCACLYYGTENEGNNKDSKKATGTSGDETFFQSSRGHFKCSYDYWRYGFLMNIQAVSMAQHWAKLQTDSMCLVTMYTRLVLVCLKTDRGNINPPHEWFHAMDPDTYDRPSAGHALPLCKDEGCMNYYRRPMGTASW
jgi:hypothetical protein